MTKGSLGLIEDACGYIEHMYERMTLPVDLSGIPSQDLSGIPDDEGEEAGAGRPP